MTTTRTLTQLARRTGAYFTLITLAVILGFPLVWLVLTSVKDQREVFSRFFPSQVDLSNYVRVWEGMNLPVHLWNSIVVVAINVTIVVVTATLAGYAFAKLRFPRRDMIFYAFIVAMMIPPQAILIPMFQFLRDFGLLNTRSGLALSLTGGAVAFAIFLMRAFFRSLPSELAEAGRIDGCNEWQVFRHIFLPLAKPGIATVVIFQFMNTWNEFMFSTTYIRSPNLTTIQPALYQVVGRYVTDYTALSAGLVLAIIPIVTVFLILQRQFISGMTAGAFKG